MFRLFTALVVAASAATAWADCTCAKDKAAGNGWCSDCKEGYVDGIEIKNKKLYDTLQGTTVSADQVKKSGCGACEKAYAGNSTCDACHVSFASGKMYKSAHAAHLAAGTRVTKDTPMCAACKAACEKEGLEKMAQGTGWCDQCKAGFVHGVRYDSKEAFESAKKSYAIVSNAAQASSKCEGCAIAMVTDGECEHCKVSFKNGEMAKTKP